MKLSEKHIEVISRVVAEELEKQEKKREKQKRDYRLHNIKLLLKNYRSLVLHCQTLKQDLEVIDNTSIQDLEIELINLESIESLKKSKKNTLAMVAFIDIKIKAYKKSCSEEELKYFRVLEKTYLTTNKYSTKEIAEFENIEVTTVYKYLNKAIENLPIIFFGIGAIEFKQ